VLPIYIAALATAAAVLLAQVVFGHHGGDTHDGPQAEHGAHDGVTPLTFVTSVRFWAFGLFAFGLVGTLVTLFAFAGAGATAALAGAAGVASGIAAVLTLRALARRGTSSHASSGEIVGKVGRVVVPPNERGALKVRVDVKGSSVDYVATSSEALGEGDAVLVEDVEGDEVRVSRAPREIKP
jgi:membrane protein implicated in regulation of membrane protease activity